jgi:diadenylate cyclase
MTIFSIGFLTFRVIDLIDVLLVAAIFYQALVLVKGTRSTQILFGAVVVIVASFLAFWFPFSGLQWLFRNLATVGFVLLVVVFQPELRAMLAQLGQSRWFRRIVREQEQHAADQITRAAVRLAELRYGGLIVIEQGVGLRAVVETGKELDADLSSELLITLFTPYTPLHDGAVIVRREKIVAGACTLPLSQNAAYTRSFGMRHKAALGITEESDAVVVVISEETGEVSVAFEGKLERNIEKFALRDEITKHLHVAR